MTLTTRAMNWLNQNRHRSYPLQEGEWRASASPDGVLDCILLDAVAMDAGESPEGRALLLKGVSIGDEATSVSMSYGGKEFEIELSGGSSEEGRASFDARNVEIRVSENEEPVWMSLVFSSHEYLKGTIGTKDISFGDGCPVLSTRIVSITEGHGVNGVSTKGSANVEGHQSASVADGVVELEDGYRTSPVIDDGRVLVRVGTKFGIDPCHYPENTQYDDCSRLLFFFCGQNGVNSGNVNIEGGRGINVTQGRTYYGIPCIEIVATKELLELYAPDARA